jgi:hypothetical protein
MKNYQQTVKQRRVKLDKLKHAYALNKKDNWPFTYKDTRLVLARKQHISESYTYWW